MSAYFNPRSPHGERQHGLPLDIHAKYFNPRSPHGERRRKGRKSYWRGKNFNPRSPHGERHGGCRLREGKENISIHAPRTGSDSVFRSIRSLDVTFQSTLPARGATAPNEIITQKEVFQSTLPARGATVVRRECAVLRGISIHAPRTGSDSAK